MIARLRCGPLGLYLDDLAAFFSHQGCVPSNMRLYPRAGEQFGRWLYRHGYVLKGRDKAVIHRYASGLKRYCFGHLLWERRRSLFYDDRLDSVRALFEALCSGVEKPRPLLTLDSS